MTVPTLFVDRPCQAGAVLTLEGRRYHYLVRVMRIKAGDHVRLGDARGGLAVATVQQINDRQVTVLIRELTPKYRSRFKLTLVTSGTRHRGAETLAAQCGELGVDTLILVNMRRTVAKIEAGKLDRLNRLAREAARKVAQPQVTDVRVADNLKAVLELLTPTPLFMMSEEFGESAAELDLGETKEAAVFVGPEGGFDSTEIDLLMAGGARPVTLQGPAYTAKTAALLGCTLFLLKGGRL